MRQQSSSRLLSLTCTLLLGSVATAQDLDATVRDMLQRADNGPLSQVWQIGRQISDLKGKEERLASAIQKQFSSLKLNGRLAAATALQEITDGTQFGKEIFTALKPVIQSKNPESVRAALAMTKRDTFFNSRTQRELRALVKPMVVSDLTDPVIRVSSARTLWQIGTNEQQRLAKKVLLDFVKSSDRRLRIMGALALADINADSNSPGWPILQEIADEPTAEGQLARTYLRIENQRRTFDVMLRQISEKGLDKSGKGAKDEEFALIREILARVAQRHVRGDTIGRKQMIEEAARGLLRSLDRHSTYLSSDQFKKFYFDLNPEYGGIGAFVNFDKDDVFSIVRPIYSGPAYKANLRSGDKILEVDGWETSGHTSDEIISKLKGKPGTKVKIKIFRRGWNEPKLFSIGRRKIQVPSVNHELLPGDVGYVEIITFGGATSKELAKALTDLQARGVKGLILDLRNNTGGYLEIAKEVVELFVKGRKMVVYTKGREVPRQEYMTGDRAILADIPLVVLVNGYSASASEITAGALQDHGRATIVGERSYGKGSVQSLLPLMSNRPEPYKDTNRNRQFDEWEPYEDLNDNGKYDIGPRLKLTIAHYYLPSGRCVDKQLDSKGEVIDPDWGVTPDKVLKLRDTPVRDRWKEAVIYDLLEKDVFAKYVGQHLAKNRTLFVELAEGDQGSVAKYPAFEAFYKSLDTKLSRDDIRRWVRYSVRDKVSDLRSKAFPGGRAVGDFQEDAQLQEGIRSVLVQLKKDIREVPAYKNILKIKFGEATTKDAKKVGKK
jgi:carboxyl-terminal processing protease